MLRTLDTLGSAILRDQLKDLISQAAVDIAEGKDGQTSLRAPRSGGSSPPGSTPGLAQWRSPGAKTPGGGVRSFSWEGLGESEWDQLDPKGTDWLRGRKSPTSCATCRRARPLK